MGYNISIDFGAIKGGSMKIGIYIARLVAVTEFVSFLFEKFQMDQFADFLTIIVLVIALLDSFGAFAKVGKFVKKNWKELLIVVFILLSNLHGDSYSIRAPPVMVASLIMIILSLINEAQTEKGGPNKKIRAIKIHCPFI